MTRVVFVSVLAALLLSAGSPEDAARDLDNVEDKAVLFTRKVPGDGFWEFCLTGSKPATDLFSFHVVLTRDAGAFRVDGVRVVRAEDTRIDVCARQDPKAAAEQKLRAGERVEVVAIGRTRGPVHLGLAVHEVKSQ